MIVATVKGTKGSAGENVPSGNTTDRSPSRNRIEASRNALMISLSSSRHRLNASAVTAWNRGRGDFFTFLGRRGSSIKIHQDET